MPSPLNNRENKPKKGGICVANHTSPIDIVVLCNDGCYAMVQSHLFFLYFSTMRGTSEKCICVRGTSVKYFLEI